jgi:hypothetical protein
MGYFDTIMRLVLLAIRTALLLLPVALSADPGMLVPADAVSQLAGEASLVRSLGQGAALTLVPRVASAAAIAAEVRTSAPTVGVEVLRIFRGLPAPADARGWDSPEGLLRLYNALHATSTLKGITYWSASRKERRVLFTESFAIASPGKIAAIPDPMFTSIPAHDEMHTFQQDQSYGKNTYRQEFEFGGDHLVVRVLNTSTISLALVPVIRPGGLVSLSILVPEGRDLLYYGVSWIRTSFPLGDMGKRRDSLANRLIAMGDWLRTRLAP